MNDATTRKRKERAQKKALGIQRMEVQLTQTERDRLDELCRLRSGGGEPYTTDELVSLLIHRNWQQLQRELKRIEPCPKCGNRWPASCEGLFKGDQQCWLTRQAKKLML